MESQAHLGDLVELLLHALDHGGVLVERHALPALLELLELLRGNLAIARGERQLDGLDSSLVVVDAYLLAPDCDPTSSMPHGVSHLTVIRRRICRMACRT